MRVLESVHKTHHTDSGDTSAEKDAEKIDHLSNNERDRK